MIILLGLTAAARAEEPPETAHLVGAGLLMAIPTYAIGVALHEGSHALAGKLSGAEVTALHLLPGVRRGKFYFGYVEVRGLRCDRQRAAFLIAPKLTDLALLSAFAASYYGGVQPANPYGRLALTVMATGLWVDFAKDIPAFWDHNDMVKVYRIAGAETELGRLPFRLLHAALAGAAAFAIVESYEDIFARGETSGDALAVPLWTGAF